VRKHPISARAIADRSPPWPHDECNNERDDCDDRPEQQTRSDESPDERPPGHGSQGCRQDAPSSPNGLRPNAAPAVHPANTALAGPKYRKASRTLVVSYSLLLIRHRTPGYKQEVQPLGFPTGSQQRPFDNVPGWTSDERHAKGRIACASGRLSSFIRGETDALPVSETSTDSPNHKGGGDTFGQPAPTDEHHANRRHSPKACIDDQPMGVPTASRSASHPIGITPSVAGLTETGSWGT